MKTLDAYSILIILSILVVISYIFNYIARTLKIPSVLLLIGSGIGLKYAGDFFGLTLPGTQTLLELLGITGLIFIVLEAALDLRIEKHKLPLMGKAFLAAFVLLFLTAGLIGVVFMTYYHVNFRQALIHAIPLSVISSAIAIPSVAGMGEERKEFVVCESAFSDILGIIAFNFFVFEPETGWTAAFNFSMDLLLILIISIVSTAALVLLLHYVSSHVRFFLTFAIIILTYSVAKYFHLPSLVLVLCFGLVLSNYKLLNFPRIRLVLSFDKLTDVLGELKMMTAETAFIIRTFFFLLFGYTMNLTLLQSQEVVIMGLTLIVLILGLRYVFLRVILPLHASSLTFIAPRGLITILLFYSIPAEERLPQVSDGILFILIVLTGVAMFIGLMVRDKAPTAEPGGS
ncbi:MAG: cation:proton antiporter [Bacteroidetes bacterium]|nr:cation:proton antiporter [Bacteroidota bacterium]